MGAKALLVGNWRYDDPGRRLLSVHGPEYNLKELGKALADEEYGLFADGVEVRENLTGAMIGVEIENFIKAAKPTDQLLFYYTGHGDRTAAGNLVLCGVDVTWENRDALSFDTRKLSDWLEYYNRAPATVLVLDCCYSGNYLGNAEDAALEQSLGHGVAVLSSGGNEPSAASFDAESPTDFTRVLAGVLTDPALPGSRGRLTAAEVYSALLSYSPALAPRPVLKLRESGHLALARRRDTDANGTPATPLRGGLPIAFDTVDISFHGNVVTTTGKDYDHAGYDLTLSSLRQVPLRRIVSLVDAVVRESQDVGQDPELEQLIRRSWQALGTNLLEGALPPDLYGGLAGRPRQAQAPTLRLRLHFDDRAKALSRLPWEYLYLPSELSGQHDSTEEVEVVHPLGLRQEIMIERSLSPVARVRAEDEGAGPPGPPARNRHKSDHNPSKAPPGGRVRTAPTSAGGPVERDPQPASPALRTKLEVGIVNALPARYQRMADRLQHEVVGLSTTILGLGLGLTDNHASWMEVLDAVELAPPHCLVLMAPVQRRQGTIRVVFPSDDDGDGSRSISEVEKILSTLRPLKLVVLITVAAPPSRDAYRSSIDAAQHMGETLRLPVVFMCHTPGLERTLGASAQPVTFTGMLLHALSESIPLDQAFCYARNYVMRTMSDTSRLLFGVPGIFTHGEADDVLGT